MRSRPDEGAGLPTSAPPPAPPPSAPPHDYALAEEARLLESARDAIARHDADGALAAALAHERRFPAGQLQTQREVLFVQALVLAGRTDEARARATRFRQRFPDSILLPVIDRALK
jgi:outer membrane protein assembly factor BamD (BamD/ComL family)